MRRDPFPAAADLLFSARDIRARDLPGRTEEMNRSHRRAITVNGPRTNLPFITPRPD